MSSNRKLPINRSNKFFSEKEWELEIGMGREYIEEDLNISIVLFRVDRQRTQKDDLYNEAEEDGIKYHPPIELKVVPILNTPENVPYNTDNNTGRHEEDSNFVFGIYHKQLEEKRTDIIYGDYIGYPIDEQTLRYFSVVNPHQKYYDNNHTILGYKGTFRTITCAPVDLTEFKGR